MFCKFLSQAYQQLYQQTENEGTCTNGRYADKATTKDQLHIHSATGSANPLFANSKHAFAAWPLCFTLNSQNCRKPTVDFENGSQYANISASNYSIWGM